MFQVVPKQTLVDRLLSPARQSWDWRRRLKREEEETREGATGERAGDACSRPRQLPLCCSLSLPALPWSDVSQKEGSVIEWTQTDRREKNAGSRIQRRRDRHGGAASSNIEKETDAILRVTLTTYMHKRPSYKKWSGPRAVPGVILGHEFVGIVEETGQKVRNVRPGQRVAVNVETFCGNAFLQKRICQQL